MNQDRENGLRGLRVPVPDGMNLPRRFHFSARMALERCGVSL
jgi:hypothetical protein